MRSRLCTIGLAAVVTCACASNPRTRSFQDLPKFLVEGNAIRLTETTGPTTTGRLETLSPASLKILADGQIRDVPEPRVAKIERRERQVGRGALIGLGVGFGVGLLTSHSQNSSGSSIVDAEGAGINLIGSTVLGTVVGAIVGAAAKVHRPVYEAPTPPKPASTESTQFRE